MSAQFCKSELLDAFCEALIDFWKDACSVFPDDYEIKSACMAVQTASRLNQSFVYSTFRTGVYPYKSYIDREDDKFFLQKSYEGDVSNQSVLEKITEMRTVLAQMSGVNKTKVFAHLQGLCTLVELIEKQDIKAV
tara:strand:+ start:65 stop:469 length:405 start_codon:yes stop_codon:yes gene_type:complete